MLCDGDGRPLIQVSSVLVCVAAPLAFAASVIAAILAFVWFLHLVAWIV